MKVSPAFSKAVESRGKASGRPPQRAELSCAYLSAGGGLRGNPRRGFPLILRFCVCAVSLGSSLYPLLPFDPFLWCLPKEMGSSRQRKAPFLPRRLHHSRERYRSVVGTFLARLGAGLVGVCGIVRVRRFLGRWIVAPTARSTPFLCSCAKKRGGAPKKRAFGCRHGRCSVPPTSPTDSKPQHHSRLRQADFAWPIYPPCTNQLDASICPVGAYAQMGEAGGPTKVTWWLQSAFLWRLDTVSLGKHQRNGVEWQGKPMTPSQRIGAHA